MSRRVVSAGVRAEIFQRTEGLCSSGSVFSVQVEAAFQQRFCQGESVPRPRNLVSFERMYKDRPRRYWCEKDNEIILCVYVALPKRSILLVALFPKRARRIAP